MPDTGDTKERKPDAFALSDEDFQAALAEASTVGDTGDGDKDAQEPPGQKQGAGDTGPQAASDTQPKTQPDKPFTLDEPPAADVKPPAAGDGQPQMFEIVHNGRVHRLTREGVIMLAQKGFDYDTKIGPHKKIIQLVESDPAAAALLDAYARTGRLPAAPPAGPAPPQPKLKPLHEYDNEIDWFKDNFEALQQLTTPSAAPPASAPPAGAAPPAVGVVDPAAPRDDTPAPAGDVQRIADTLASRDPKNYARVAPHLMEYAQRYLTLEQYQKVNSSMANLVQFYDWVRDQVLAQAPPGKAGTAGTAGAAAPPAPDAGSSGAAAPPFRMQSGGGQPPREDGAKKAWELPNKEFESIIARAKGF